MWIRWTVPSEHGFGSFWLIVLMSSWATLYVRGLCYSFSVRIAVTWEWIENEWEIGFDPINLHTHTPHTAMEMSCTICAHSRPFRQFLSPCFGTIANRRHIYFVFLSSVDHVWHSVSARIKCNERTKCECEWDSEENDDENNKNNRNGARDGDRAIRVVRHAGRISPFPTEWMQWNELKNLWKGSFVSSLAVRVWVWVWVSMSMSRSMPSIVGPVASAANMISSFISCSHCLRYYLQLVRLRKENLFSLSSLSGPK